MANPMKELAHGEVTAVLQLFSALGVTRDDLSHMLQRVIDDPVYRTMAFAILSDANADMAKVIKADWVVREVGIFIQLDEFGIRMPSEREVAKSWFEGCTPNHRFVPHNLERRQLLEACHKAGIKVNGNDPKTADFDGGDKLPTEQGTLDCDLTTLMQPTDAKHRPFMQNHDQQVQWAKKQGGDGITSVEETLYLILRAWVEISRVPFMGGWIRCRNRYDSGSSLRVYWNAGIGLDVDYGYLECDGWYCGAFSRKFRPTHGGAAAL